MRKILFYDCEISKCIPDRDGYKNPRYQYCDGWHDFENMGVACVGVFSWHGYQYFLESDLANFQLLVDEADEIIGFNSIAFDDILMSANGVRVRTTYDLLCEVRIASGQPPHYVRGLTRGGYNLDALARKNLRISKTGSGDLAPKRWQRGEKFRVINYCLNDVKILVELYELRSHLRDPNTNRVLFLKDGNKLDYLWYMLNEVWASEFYSSAIRKFKSKTDYDVDDIPF